MNYTRRRQLSTFLGSLSRDGRFTVEKVTKSVRVKTEVVTL